MPESKRPDLWSWCWSCSLSWTLGSSQPFPFVSSLGSLMMHCTHWSRFSPHLFFFYPSFYITMPSYKLGPGKLDYPGNSIFQILSSYRPFGAEQRLCHLKSASSLCFTSQIVGWHYWLSRSYFFVSPRTINAVLTQMMGNPQTEQYKTGWRVTADVVVRRVMKRDGEAFLSWITAHSSSFSSALTLTSLFPQHPPPPPLLWNPTAVLIPRILLQGLISFPFLERLFKYCYIYRRSSSASLSLSLPSSLCTDWGKFPFFLLHLFSFVSYLPCVFFTPLLWKHIFTLQHNRVHEYRS